MSFQEHEPQAKCDWLKRIMGERQRVAILSSRPPMTKPDTRDCDVGLVIFVYTKGYLLLSGPFSFFNHISNYVTNQLSLFLKFTARK